MIALIRWVLGFLLTLVFVFFAAFNRQPVELFYSPLHDPIELPLFAVALGFSALAFLIGGVTVWLSDGKIRRERRGLKRTVKSLEKKLENTDDDKASKPDNPLFPAITKQ